MSDPSAARVMAVVVARERTDTLREVVDAMRAQTRRPDGLLVVANDPVPDVRDLLSELEPGAPPLELCHTGYNAGGAGGFSIGIEAAAARDDVDLVWVFDDDAIPALDCLERLLASSDGATRLGAIGAASCAPDGELAWDLNVARNGRPVPISTLAELNEAADAAGRVSVTELAWHALLIPAQVIRRLGPPMRELFMWYEDVEYGLRLRDDGLRLYAVPAARVTHPPAPRTIRVRLPRVTLAVPVTTGWRTYLMVRNSLVVRQRYGGARFWVADLPLELIRGVVAALALPDAAGAQRLGIVARAAADAARGRMGAPPAYLRKNSAPKV